MGVDEPVERLGLDPDEAAAEADSFEIAGSDVAADGLDGDAEHPRRLGQ